MAFPKKYNDGNWPDRDTAKAEKPVLQLQGLYIQGARQISEKCILFTLGAHGCQFYDLKVVEGTKGHFISTPQRKAPDGSYHNIFRLYFDKQTEEAIIQTVFEHFADDPKSADFKHRYEVQ